MRPDLSVQTFVKSRVPSLLYQSSTSPSGKLGEEGGEEGAGEGGDEAPAGGGQGASERRRRCASVAGSATRSIDEASITSSVLSVDVGSPFAALNLEKANSVAWALAIS